MNLLRSIQRPARDNPLSLDQWAEYFTFGLNTYKVTPSQTIQGDGEKIANSFTGYIEGAYKRNGVVFACMLARMLLFSEARFKFRRQQTGRPGELFGTTALAPLEQPWPNGTTGDLLSRAIQDVDLAGNFYALKQGQRLRRLRPDWTAILMGSQEANVPPDDPSVEVLGYAYQPGGPTGQEEPTTYLREQVVHFAPIPDPAAKFRGMSWLTPVIGEIEGDGGATTHKKKFFENGATPNMVVKLDATKREDFDRWVKAFKEGYEGFENAYKTLFLGGGADAKVVGADMRQIDFKATQGHGETRIAAAAGVPPVIVGLSEGLEAATYSNYGQARRRFADGTMRPLWRNMAGSLATVIDVPAGAELWYDDRDIPFLQEDMKDAAEVQQLQATAIKTLVDAGFRPDAVVAAVLAGDLGRLDHTGLVSVQLLPPGTTPAPNGTVPVPALNGQ